MSERQGKGRGEGDPLAPATDEELAAAKRLRDALEDDAIPNDDAAVAHALKAAWSPEAIEAAELEAIVAAAVEGGSREGALELARALDGAAPTTAEAELAVALRNAWAPRALDEAENAALVAKAIGGAGQSSRRGVVVRVAFGASVSVLALAASVLLYLNVRETESPAAPLARTRSTQPLFSEPFRPGEASARIDRIALARASDLRDNRFARWGVRR